MVESKTSTTQLSGMQYMKTVFWNIGAFASITVASAVNGTAGITLPNYSIASGQVLILKNLQCSVFSVQTGGALTYCPFYGFMNDVSVPAANQLVVNGIVTSGSGSLSLGAFGSLPGSFSFNSQGLLMANDLNVQFSQGLTVNMIAYNFPALAIGDQLILHWTAMFEVWRRGLT